MLQRYVHWLHGRWPAGGVEKLPLVAADSSTNVPGLFITGDLTGVPLLKFAADTGARAVATIVADGAFQRLRQAGGDEGAHDLVIIGGGVSGVAAALQARKQDLDFVLIEATEPFSTVVNFPRGKPIFTYPSDMTPAGPLQINATVKEELVAELRAQSVDQDLPVRTGRAEAVRRRGKLFEVLLAGEEPLLARRVIVAIGRSGNFRKLGVPGEDLDKVSNRLHDPKDFCGQRILVVGGGDSALETAIATASCGSHVTLSYRNNELSRPKPENIERLNALIADPGAPIGVSQPVSDRVTATAGAYLERPPSTGSVELMLGSQVERIDDESVTLKDASGESRTIDNDAVFSMIGREPPLDFFRRSGVRIIGETSRSQWFWIITFFLAMVAMYDWKNDGFLSHGIAALSAADAFPNNMPAWLASLGDRWRDAVEDRSSFLGVLAVSMKGRSFYYTLLYTLCILVFGILRIRRRRTPYVTLQTGCLFLVQLIPLFLLPELLLPLLGYNGWFESGFLASSANELFPLYGGQTDSPLTAPDWGHPREYWRAYGFILAWPLSVYNVFTEQPYIGWLVISLIQSFVLIPLLIHRFGKGAYCGWICSCGGLAETLGDTHRTKMPHGAGWNRLNLVGQVLLALAFLLFAVRVYGWAVPGSWADRSFLLLLEGKNSGGELVNPLSWKWVVDILFGGILGVGLYFKYSGRVWCRFACPLAALMHIYARFSRFRIIAEKKKCISCNVCTSVCHQGIDVMGFANKGVPMADPQCVRCSACVQSCPTGVLRFGEVDPKTGEVLRTDKLVASPVIGRESKEPIGS